MRTPEAMKDLIERLEKAEGPDRELDKEIIFALYPEASIQPYCIGDEPIVFHAEPLVENRSEVPAFTGSIDAALTLGRKGWIWRLDGGGKSYSYCIVGKPSEKGNFREPHKYPASHRTPAIALCIAALKSRSHAEGEGR